MNYLNKKINSNFYSVIKVSSISPEESVDCKKGLQSGYVLVPYTIGQHTVESSKQYDKFIKEYDSVHKYCPICHELEHTTTLVGYILNLDKKDEYKDMNICICTKCGDRHSKHDRNNIKTFSTKKYKI